MTSERWQKVDELLQAALERAPAERAAWLAEACAGDVELQHEVASLLEFHQSTSDSFLEKPPAAVAAALVEEWVTTELRPGQALGDYELLRPLGHGGMGRVYLVRDKQLGRQVALKLLPRRFTSDRERVRRFRQEARAIAALSHPNILTLHEIGQLKVGDSDLHFLAMEFVEGKTLRARLNEPGMPLTLEEALDIAMQTARALLVAHHTGVIHRDIKPENLMLQSDGIVKVLDFGLAKLKNKTLPKTTPGTFSTVITNPGAVLGTPNYMSPEQARGLDVDERSDLFSLGVVLYEMLAGRAPFAGATTTDVLVSILEHEPPPLTTIAPHLPAAAEAMLNRLLAKDRATRYQRAEDLLQALQALRQELMLVAHRKSSAPPAALAEPVNEMVQATTKRRDSNRGPLRAGLQRFLPAKRFVLATTLLVGLMGGMGYRYWPTTHGETIRSIAVLPFLNDSPDPAIEALSDGITENLRQRLTEVSGLRIMARSMVFAYKDRAIDPRQVGQDLGVQAVVTGRVQRQGDHLLIHAELANTHDGTRLWSEQDTHPFADVGTVQTEIARALTSKLLLRLRALQQR